MLVGWQPFVQILNFLENQEVVFQTHCDKHWSTTALVEKFSNVRLRLSRSNHFRENFQSYSKYQRDALRIRAEHLVLLHFTIRFCLHKS